MVFRYIGDDGQFGSYDIGGIKTSTHTDLNHGIVYTLRSKPVERHHHRQLEEAGMARIIALTEALYEIHYGILGNHLSIDADALAEVYEMRGSIESHPIALALEDGGQHMGGASFSVGAAYVDAFKAFVGVAEIRVEVEACLKSGLIGGSSGA